MHPRTLLYIFLKIHTQIYQFFLRLKTNIHRSQNFFNSFPFIFCSFLSFAHTVQTKSIQISHNFLSLTSKCTFSTDLTSPLWFQTWNWAALFRLVEALGCTPLIIWGSGIHWLSPRKLPTYRATGHNDNQSNPCILPNPLICSLRNECMVLWAMRMIVYLRWENNWAQRFLAKGRIIRAEQFHSCQRGVWFSIMGWCPQK